MQSKNQVHFYVLKLIPIFTHLDFWNIYTYGQIVKFDTNDLTECSLFCKTAMPSVINLSEGFSQDKNSKYCGIFSIKSCNLQVNEPQLKKLPFLRKPSNKCQKKKELLQVPQKWTYNSSF